MNRTQNAWTKRKVAGALFMDVKSAFNNVDKTFLGKSQYWTVGQTFALCRYCPA